MSTALVSGHNGGGNGDTGHNGGDYLVSLTISTGRSSSSSPFIWKRNGELPWKFNWLCLICPSSAFTTDQLFCYYTSKAQSCPRGNSTIEFEKYISEFRKIQKSSSPVSAVALVHRKCRWCEAVSDHAATSNTLSQMLRQATKFFNLIFCHMPVVSKAETRPCRDAFENWICLWKVNSLFQKQILENRTILCQTKNVPHLTK